MPIFHLLFILFLFIFSFHGLAKDNEVDVLIKGNLIMAPPCKINQGEDIEVNFGSIPTKTIQGYEQKKEINYQITCEDNLNNWSLYLWIDGNKSGFDRHALKTNIDNLAVKFMKGSSIIDLAKKYTVNPNNPEKLWAVLVKQDNTELPAGSFVSNGTLYVEYQ